MATSALKESSPADGLPTPARYRAMAVVILGIVLAVLDGTIVNLALPVITHDFAASAAQAIWVINAYQIAILAFLLPCAALGDLYGYRRVYLGGLALFTLASLGCAFATSLPALAAIRAIQGLGAAGIMSVNAALVRLIYPRAQLGKGVAINSMAVAVAAVAGPSIAAAILSIASWPWLFAVNLPIGLFVFFLGRGALPVNPGSCPKTGLSWFDVALNALMFSLIFLGVDALGVRDTPGPDAALFNSTFPLLAGLLIGVLYLRRQARQSLPIFPVDLLRIPIFALSMCTSVSAFTAQMLAYVSLPFLFLDAYGRTPLQAGALITAWPLAIVVIAPLIGRAIGRIPDGTLGGIGMGILSLGLVLLATLPGDPADTAIVWRLALCGVGFGVFQSPNNHTIVTSAPLHRSGGASGMLGTARLTGQTIGAVIVAIVFGIADPHNGHGPTIALGLAAGFAALAGVLSTLRVRVKNS